MTKLKDVRVECKFHGKDFEACKQYSGQFACEPVISVIGDKIMNIEIDKSYWHLGQNKKVWIKEELLASNLTYFYIAQDVEGEKYLAFSYELEEV